MIKPSKTALRFAAIIVTTCLLFNACKKKEKDPEPETATVEESGQSSSDSRSAIDENDNAVNDINTTIGDYTKLMGKGTTAAGASTVCGMIVDTTGMSTGSITLNYNGATCLNRTRTGTIKLAIVNYTAGVRWKHAGAVVRIEYVNYKVARASDGKSIMLNGVQNLMNNSGGTWWDLYLTPNYLLITSITGTNLKATFEDGKTATYNINRKFTYTYPNNVLTCMGEGVGTSGNLLYLENYGTTRDGDAFTSQVSTPIKWNLTCGPWAPIQGVVNVKVASKNFDLKCIFGVDQAGNVVTVGANQCPYGWKLEWTVNNKTSDKLFKYY
jgi:hypothetical protein